MMDTNFEEESQNVIIVYYIHFYLYAFLSHSAVSNVVTPIACNRGFSVIYKIRDHSTELDQLFKSISIDGYRYD